MEWKVAELKENTGRETNHFGRVCVCVINAPSVAHRKEILVARAVCTKAFYSHASYYL